MGLEEKKKTMSRADSAPVKEAPAPIDPKPSRPTQACGGSSSSPADTSMNEAMPPEMHGCVSRKHSENEFVVPRGFKWMHVAKDYMGRFDIIGSIEARYCFVDDDLSRMPSFTCKALGSGEETQIPSNTACVMTQLVPPLWYPNGCPEINSHLLDINEPRDPPYLKYGREALMDGLLKGTIPHHCTCKPFPIEWLGLHYREEFYRKWYPPGTKVIVCPNTAGVRIVTDHTRDDESEPDRRRFDVDGHGRWPAGAYELIQSAEDAKAWDRERAAGLLYQPPRP